MPPVRGTLGDHSTLTYTFNNGFSGFGAGMAGAALPVRLLDFTGQLRNNSVVLSWQTASEQNSKTFEIERSCDGITFTRIGVVPAAGISFLSRYYHFTDHGIMPGNNYYRLKQVDLDDQYVYSNVIVVASPVTAGHPFRIAGNPVRDHLELQFGEIPDGRVQVRITDISGRILMRWQSDQVAQRLIRIGLQHKALIKGMYLVHVRVNGKDYVEKIIKE